MTEEKGFLSLYEDKSVTKEEYAEELTKLVSPAPLASNFDPKQPLKGKNVKARIKGACQAASQLYGFEPNTKEVSLITGISENTLAAYFAKQTSKKHRELTLKAFSALVDFCYWYMWEIEVYNSRTKKYERLLSDEEIRERTKEDFITSFLIRKSVALNGNDYPELINKPKHERRQAIARALLNVQDASYYKSLQENNKLGELRAKRNTAAYYLAILASLLNEEDLDYLIQAAKRASSEAPEGVSDIYRRICSSYNGEQDLIAYVNESENLKQLSSEDYHPFSSEDIEDIYKSGYMRLLEEGVANNDMGLMRRLLGAVNDDFYEMTYGIIDF